MQNIWKGFIKVFLESEIGTKNLKRITVGNAMPMIALDQLIAENYI